MKKIYFRKTLKYDPTMQGKFTKYQGYCKSVKGEVELSINGDQSAGDMSNLPSKPDLVITSKYLRAIETGRLISSKKNYSVDYANEVKFDLSMIVSAFEFNEFGSNIVRKRFVESFIKDDLLEKHFRLKKRIHTLVEFLRSESAKSIVVISHSFFMKILEAFFEVGDDIFERPEIVKKFILEDRKTYDFGSGFEIELDQL